MPRRVFSCALFAVVFALASLALADFPSVNARRMTPSVDPAASLYLEPTPTPGPWEYNGAVWLGYAFRPAVLRDASGTIASNLVSSQFTADLTSNIGLGQRFALGFDLPAVLFQKGDDDLTTQAVALYAKGNLISYGPLGGFGLSTLLRFTAPTGNTASYLGEGASTGELRMLAEYKLIAFALQGTAGFRLRFEERDVLRRTFNHEVPWGVAISLKPQALGWDEKGRFTWVAEVHGNGFLPPSQAAQDRGQKTPVAPIMAGLSARYAPSDVSFLFGAETSLTQAFGSPPFQIIASVGWAPRTHDIDHDGVPDDVDQCPELAEDRDGFEDADGCPD
jgi:OOP family OmpA-OmpF porin